jgi:hypothetical protein
MLSKKRIVTILIAVAISMVSTMAMAETDLPALIEKVEPSVLYLKYGTEDGSRMGQASGFLISDQGHFVTNYHVLGTETRQAMRYSDSRYEAYTLDGKKYKIKGVLAENKTNDVVIGQLDLPPGIRTPYLKFAKIPSKVGEHIISISNPMGYGWSATPGIISGAPSSKRANPEGIYQFGEFYQIAVPLTHGSSGGPILNMKGEVVGVITHIEPTLDGAHAQLHFASVASNVLNLKIQGDKTVIDLLETLYTGNKPKWPIASWGTPKVILSDQGREVKDTRRLVIESILTIARARTLHLDKMTGEFGTWVGNILRPGDYAWGSDATLEEARKSALKHCKEFGGSDEQELYSILVANELDEPIVIRIYHPWEKNLEGNSIWYWEYKGNFKSNLGMEGNRLLLSKDFYMSVGLKSGKGGWPPKRIGEYQYEMVNMKDSQQLRIRLGK